MLVSINQPAFLPWLGYFHRIMLSDVHVVLDHVQFEKNSYTNRNKIYTKNGPLWLTVPVKTSGKFNNLSINSIEIENKQNWKKKILSSLQQNYSKSRYFKEYFPALESIISKDYFLLNDLIKDLTKFLFSELEIDTSIYYSSEMKLVGKKNDLIIEILSQLNSTKYLSGPLGRNYIEPRDFEELGIELTYHDYNHPIYNQMNTEFLPYLSIIDLIFNYGKKSRNIIFDK